MGDDQDKRTEEWAAALDENEEQAAGAQAQSLNDSDEALADEWAKSLADEEDLELDSPKKKKRVAPKDRDYEYEDLTAEAKAGKPEGPKKDLDFILDIPLDVSAQLGSTKLLINELLQLGQGSVVELNKLAGEPLEVLVNGKLVARGEAVVINEKFGVRLTDIISPIERVKQLG